MKIKLKNLSITSSELADQNIEAPTMAQETTTVSEVVNHDIVFASMANELLRKSD